MSGAGVLATFVAADGQRYFLTGKESVYLTDIMKTVALGGRERSIRDDLQKSAPGLTKDQAKAAFQNRAIGIGAAIGQRVQFAQPVQEGTQWTTTYRILPANFKYGIPKGRREGTESPLQTAERELEEEVGIKLKGLVEFPVRDIDRVIFRVDLDEKRDVPGILSAIQSRMARHYGELFDVGFRTADAMAGRTNAVTRLTIGQVGGRRRRRNTRRSRRRRVTRRA